MTNHPLLFLLRMEGHRLHRRQGSRELRLVLVEEVRLDHCLTSTML